MPVNSDSRLAGHWRGAAVTLLLVAVAGWLTSRQLRDLNWSEVGAALSNYDVTTVSLALFAMLIGYIAISQYDLIGRHYTGHTLAVRRVLAISFISYTFSLNLGGLIGGVGFRFRLYSRAGLPMATATRVIGLSILGNWCGYVLLAGLLFTFAPPQLPPNWNVAPPLLRGLGIVLLAVSTAYVLLCWRRAGHSWKLGHVALVVPSLSLASVQFVLSLISWCANATIIYILLPDGVSWVMVLAALLTSVTAALLAHVPGGIGVIELVCISILGHLTPEANILAALLAYRCMYYLLPLLVAVFLYVSMEILHPGAGRPDPGRQDAASGIAATGNSR